MTRRTRPFLLVITVAAFGVLSAGITPEPKVPVMILEPENYCATSAIQIDWKNVPDGTRISAEPQVFRPFTATPESGSRAAAITDTSGLEAAGYVITISMTVPDNGGTKVVAQKIATIVPPGKVHEMPIAFAPDCGSGTPSWTAAELAQRWDPALTIKSVLNTSSRAVTITHDGVSTMSPVASGGVTTALNGQSPAGNWKVDAKLNTTATEYEACQPTQGTTGMDTMATHVMPPELSITVTYGCGN